MLREDIMSDIYLAIREGQLHPREISTCARTYIRSNYERFSNRYRGAISLHAVLANDDDRRRIDMIDDPSALAAFDAIEIGGATCIEAAA